MNEDLFAVTKKKEKIISEISQKQEQVKETYHSIYLPKMENIKQKKEKRALMLAD